MSRARRERLLRIGSWFILMLALMPAITYMGHWPLAGMDVHIDTTTDSSALENHEAHCHVGVSHCAGGEAMVGSIWAGEESNLLSLNSPHVKVETDLQTSARDAEPSRILQPPRVA